MTALTDTQSIILSAASRRDGAIALPLPESLKGGAAQKVVDAMLAKGLVAAIEAGRDAPVWRETGDGQKVTLIATPAGLDAVGAGPPLGLRTKLRNVRCAGLYRREARCS